MLTPNKLGASSPRGITLLFLFISFCTFQLPVFADIKDKTAEEYRILGYAQQQKGNFFEALSYYTKAIELGLESPVVLNDMGVLYEQIGFRSKAEQYYLQSFQTDEKYLPVLSNLAYFYKVSGDVEVAFYYFKKRFELGEPSDRWTLKAKEELLKIHPEYIKWIVNREAEQLDRELVFQVHRAFSDQVKRSDEHFKRGQNFQRDGKYDRAIIEFDQALGLTPKNPIIVRAKREILLQMARRDLQERSEKALQMLDSGDTNSAKNEVRKILSTIPNEPITAQ